MTTAKGGPRLKAREHNACIIFYFWTSKVIPNKAQLAEPIILKSRYYKHLLVFNWRTIYPLFLFICPQITHLPLYLDHLSSKFPIPKIASFIGSPINDPPNSRLIQNLYHSPTAIDPEFHRPSCGRLSLNHKRAQPAL